MFPPLPASDAQPRAHHVADPQKRSFTGPFLGGPGWQNRTDRSQPLNTQAGGTPLVFSIMKFPATPAPEG